MGNFDTFKQFVYTRQITYNGFYGVVIVNITNPQQEGEIKDHSAAGHLSVYNQNLT